MSYTSESISSLPFGQLIGGPLLAAIDAQSQASKATIDFITEVGFVRDTTGLPENASKDVLFDNNNDAIETPLFGKVRMVEFTYSEVTSTTTLDRTIKVPLLSLVSPPSFGIDSMSIDFTAKVTESINSERNNSTTTNKSGSAQARAGWGPFSGSLKGSYSKNQTSNNSSSSKYSTELNMNINVRASQDHMPAGLEKLLQIFSNLVKSGS